MDFGSLFTGIGGFDLGLKLAGMQCKWQCENDPAASSVLEYQFSGIKNYYHGVESINYRTGKGYRRYEKPEAVDLICGGFPCQDVSIAGRRAGLAGERSGLWYEFHRILEQARPQWVVIENVPGLLSSNKGRDFATILQGLAKLGYGIAWRILDAQYFGVAQRRRRVFIVGSLGNGSCAQILFERESGAWDTPPRREAGQGSTSPITAGAPSRRNGGSDPVADSFIVLRPLRAQAQSSHREDSETYITFNWQSGGDMRGLNLSEKANLVTDQTPAVLVGALNSHSKKRGHAMSTQQAAESGQLVSFALNGKNGKRYDGESETLISGALHNGTPGRDASDAGNNHLVDGVRRLTPTECERLQGFPDSFTAYGIDRKGKTIQQSDSARYRQLGNAVCVPVIEWIGNRIERIK